ncbi:MAG: protein-L-isoaspartate O-methyltransferase [Flavobacteriales bacterium]|nr:protein-L-isoaspartate O-methyltransferase [Flavobacteriales bacterium]
MIDDFRHKGLRRNMVKYLKSAKNISNNLVLNAFLNVPRHLFLDSSFLEFAYQDKAFPIGSNQTISSLYTVAFQTQLIDIQPGEKVLEIGTGSGYQTAILAEIGAKVYSIERHKELHKKAKNLLKKLNYHTNLFYGDGYLGLSQEAPFDKILVTCGAADLPISLLDQLKIGGQMVIPIGFKKQVMTHFFKDKEGNIKKNEYENFQFVPLLRDKQ